MVEYWVQKQYVKGVKDIFEERDVYITNLHDYNRWLSEPKVTGNRVTWVKLFFTIKTSSTLRELVQSQIEFLKRESIRVDIKRTDDEHTNRVGFFIGPIVDRANMGWYEKAIQCYSAAAKGTVELKKDVVYEGKENEWCITVHGTWSEKDTVDKAMMNMKLGDESHVKYISFANSTRNERINALQLNKYINIKLKYECLENVDALDEIDIEEKRQTLSEVVMKAKKNGIPIFLGIEQGSGKNADHTYVYHKGSMAAEAKEWIRNVYGKTVKIRGKKDYTTLLKPVTEEEQVYQKGLNDFIIERLKYVTITPKAVNKKMSYLQAASGNNENYSTSQDSMNYYNKNTKDDDSTFTLQENSQNEEDTSTQ